MIGAGAAAVAFALLPAPTGGPPGAGDLPLFTGRAACRQCHETGSAARDCSLEAIPAHGRAWTALTEPPARHIAAISGVAEAPPESRICLGCHATGADEGPRWWRAGFDVTDGVQCEACHGAGSLHADAHRAAPGTAARPPRVRVPDRALCGACHRPRRSHETVLEAGYRVPAADARYRTPLNLALSPRGDQLYVVCERSDSLLVVDTASRRVIDEIAVGRRPHDLAVAADGRTIWVTNRLDGTVSAIDVAAGRVTAEVSVGAEPHGVAAGPAGRYVYVANTAQDSVSIVDALTRAEIRRLAAGRGPWSLALRRDGGRLLVTNVWPQPSAFREPPVSELTVIGGAAGGRVDDRRAVPGANMLQGACWVPGRDVALFTLMRTRNLVPVTRLAQGWTITSGLGVLWPDGGVDQVLLDRPGASFPDPMDVAVSPDGRIALVTSGGSDLVAAVDVEALLATLRAASDRQRRDVLPNHLGTSERFVRARIAVGRNPRGVAFAPDGLRAYVANALDDSVTVLDVTSLAPAGVIDLGGPGEVTETRRGERLFHSAAITFGRQFSCRSCHPDGHVNGLTFDIEADGIGMHPVDNRTLRGILDTAPFKWEGTNPSLRRQCGPRLAVFFTRLDPYTPAELTALVRYITTIERPPNPHRDPAGLTPAQRRGKAVFERSRTNRGELIPVARRCTTCHDGPYRTAARPADVGSTMWFDAPIETAAVDIADLSADIGEYGELGLYYFLDSGTPTRIFDTPHLTNVHDAPPYLHNGAAATLHEIWTRYDVLSLHGHVSDLTRRQLNELVEYLRCQ